MNGASVVRLEDAADRVTVSHVGPTSEYFCSKGVPFLRTGNVGVRCIIRDNLNQITQDFHRTLKKSTLKSGDIVISRVISDKINCAVIPPDLDGANCGNIIIVRPGSNLSSEYLAHLISSPLAQRTLLGLRVGSAQSVVNTTVLKNWKIPLPPLEEQKRLAAILDQADALRRARRESLARLDELAQSLFLELFGDPASNPKSWDVVPFGAIGESRLGKMLDAKQQTGKHLRPYIRNANVQWHRFDLSSVYEMDFAEKDRGVFRLTPGDLMICEGGEPGRAAIWQGELAECYYQKALHRVRLYEDKGSAQYIVYLLWFMAKQGLLSDNVTAATIAHLTGEKLATLKIPLPPLAMQQQFAEQIEELEAIKSRARASLTELDALFASLQSRAFAGELSGPT